MPSINLLPEDFAIESYKKREKVLVYLLAVFFLLFSAVAVAGAEIKKKDVQKDLEVLDTEINSVDSKIEEEINDNELLSSEYDKNDIEKLLNEHSYFSKGLDFLKDKIIKDVYLQTAKFSKNESGEFELEIAAGVKDYNAAAAQIVALKDSYWVKDVNIKTIDSEKGNETIMSGTITLKKELFVFSEQYWNFGLEVLTANSNRYISIDAYTAILKKVKDEKTKEEKEYISVTFKGKAYKESELDNFETKLKADNLNIQSIEIKRDNPSQTVAGVINFKGEMLVKH